MILSVLKAETVLEKDLAVDYPTAELRKINAKIQRGREVTPQERSELQGSSLVFLGKTKKGFVFESQSSIGFLEDYIVQLPIYKRTVEMSNRYMEKGKNAESLSLGVSISQLRSNSIFFSDFIKTNLHIYPKEVTGFLKDLIEESIDLKNGVKTDLYRLSVEDVQMYLLKIIPYKEITKMYKNSAGVALSEKDIPYMRDIFVKVLQEASRIDIFMQNNPELTLNFELLHEKYSVFFLHYFYHFLKEPLKKKIRVSSNTLLTFYRKGVELSGNL